jgi:methionyl-tRNA formyltransferase
MKHNVIYLGNNARACDYIHCHKDFNVTAVICQSKMLNDELLTCCYVREIPIIEIKNHANLSEQLNLAAGTFDFVIMLSFGIMIREEILQSHTIYNIHPSYLPKYKGKNCTFYTIMAGEKEAGISLHKVTIGIDEGEIISRKTIPLYYWMGNIALWENLLEQVPNLLTDLNDYLSDNNYSTFINNNEHYFPPVDQSMLYITGAMPAKDIINLVRSQENYSGVRLAYNNTDHVIKKIKVSCLDKADLESYTINENIISEGNIPVGIILNDKYYLKLS